MKRYVFFSSYLNTGFNPIIFALKMRLLVFNSRGGGSHMKQMGMLVVSLRGVNFGFWSRLGHSANILSRQETQNYAKRNRSQIFLLTSFVFIFVCVSAVSFRGQNLLKPRPDWSPLGVTKSLSHAQMVSLRG